MKRLTSTMLMVLVLTVAMFAKTQIPVSEAVSIIITATPGENFTFVKWLGIIRLKITPTMAFWIEDTDGKFIKTIYVTQKAAKAKWIGGKNVQRPFALPVWSYARGIETAPGVYMPTKEKPLLDALSGASPKKEFSKIISAKDLEAGKYVIKAEINNSYDYNDTYKKGIKRGEPYYNDVNGQPGVVYAAEITIGGADCADANSTAKTTVLKPIGTSSVTGTSGVIESNLDKITTATKIFSEIEVEIK